MVAADENALRQIDALVKLAETANKPVVSALWAAEAAEMYKLFGEDEKATGAYQLAESFARQVKPEATATFAKDGIDVILALEYAERINLRNKANQLYAQTLELDRILRNMRYTYGPGVAVELKDPSNGQVVILPPYLIQVADDAISLHSQLVIILSKEEGRQNAERNLKQLVQVRELYS